MRQERAKQQQQQQQIDQANQMAMTAKQLSDTKIGSDSVLARNMETNGTIGL